MSEKLTYKPIGGVVAAELYLVRDLASAEDIIPGSGLAVALVDDGSHYDESFTAEQGAVSVNHSLTLCSDRNSASAWFDVELMQIASTEGVAALITLATGEQLRLGWSRKFGFEQALRFKSLEFHSGMRPGEEPRVSLTLCSRDTSSAIG